MKTHYYGKAITMADKESNPYLYDYLWNHTECRLLLKKDEGQFMTRDKDAVTCKNCLRILNKVEQS